TATHLFKSGLQPLGELAAVFPHQHETKSQHGLALSISGGGAAPDLACLSDCGDVTHVNGDAFNAGDDHRLDVLDPQDETLATHQECLASFVDDSACGVAIAFLKCVGHVIKGQSVLHQKLRVYKDVDLLFKTAPGVDLGYPFDLDHLRTDHPVVQGTELLRGERFAGNDVLKHLAQAG